MIERERSDGSYRLSAYFISEVITEIPFQLIGSTVFTLISYWMAGLRKEAGPFFLFLALMYASNIAFSGAGLIIGSVARNLRVASASAMVFMYLWFVQHSRSMLVAGFYRPSLLFRSGLDGFNTSILPSTFTMFVLEVSRSFQCVCRSLTLLKFFQGTVQTLFSGLSLPSLSGDMVSGDSVIAGIYPFIPQPATWNVMALFAFAIVFRVVAFIALKLSFRFAAK